MFPETMQHTVGKWFLSTNLVVGWWASCETCKVVGPVRASQTDALFIFDLMAKEQKGKMSC